MLDKDRLRHEHPEVKGAAASPPGYWLSVHGSWGSGRRLRRDMRLRIGQAEGGKR